MQSPISCVLIMQHTNRLSSHTFLVHHIPSFTITYLPCPLHTFLVHHIPSFSITYLPFPSHTFLVHHTPSFSQSSRLDIESIQSYDRELRMGTSMMPAQQLQEQFGMQPNTSSSSPQVCRQLCLLLFSTFTAKHWPSQ